MIKVDNRKAKFIELKNYCYISNNNSYIEVTEWTNGEGVDVVIDSHGIQRFSLTHGEFQALQLLMMYEEDR